MTSFARPFVCSAPRPAPDYRSRQVALTAAGQALHAKARPMWADAERRFARSIGEDAARELRMTEAGRDDGLRAVNSRHCETIQFSPNELGLSDGIRQRNSAVERLARLTDPIELFEQRATQPVQIEVRIELAP